MRMHAGRRLAEKLEAGDVVLRGLAALLPGEEDDVARTRQALVLDGLDEALRRARATASASARRRRP